MTDQKRLPNGTAYRYRNGWLYRQYIDCRSGDPKAEAQVHLRHLRKNGFKCMKMRVENFMRVFVEDKYFAVNGQNHRLLGIPDEHTVTP